MLFYHTYVRIATGILWHKKGPLKEHRGLLIYSLLALIRKRLG